MLDMAETTSLAQRLSIALQSANIFPMSSTKVATEFNLRHYGNPVSPQAVRKWLSGSAIPSPDKVATLGNWLGVSPAWLLFGTDLGVRDQKNENHPDLLGSFNCLSAESQEVVYELVCVLLARQRRM
jgi:transcriptional regulator with XRE-family HTH domain